MSANKMESLADALAAIDVMQQNAWRMQEEINKLTLEVQNLRSVVFVPTESNTAMLQILDDAKTGAKVAAIDTTYAALFGEMFSDKITPILSANNHKSVRDQLFDHLVGENSLFTKNLSSIVIDNGTGGVPDSKQYSEDIFTVGPVTLLNWPDGFYLNCTTKEVQYLVSTALPCLIFCLDGLPSNKGKLLVYEFEDGEVLSSFIERNNGSLSIEKLMFYCKELEEAFSESRQ